MWHNSNRAINIVQNIFICVFHTSCKGRSSLKSDSVWFFRTLFHHRLQPCCGLDSPNPSLNLSFTDSLVLFQGSIYYWYHCHLYYYFTSYGFFTPVVTASLFSSSIFSQVFIADFSSAMVWKVTRNVLSYPIIISITVTIKSRIFLNSVISRCYIIPMISIPTVIQTHLQMHKSADSVLFRYERFINYLTSVLWHEERDTILKSLS